MAGGMDEAATPSLFLQEVTLGSGMPGPPWHSRSQDQASGCVICVFFSVLFWFSVFNCLSLLQSSPHCSFSPLFWGVSLQRMYFEVPYVPWGER